MAPLESHVPLLAEGGQSALTDSPTKTACCRGCMVFQRNIEALLPEKGALEAELEAEGMKATDVCCQESESRSESTFTPQDVIAEATWGQLIHDLSLPRHGLSESLAPNPLFVFMVRTLCAVTVWRCW